MIHIREAFYEDATALAEVVIKSTVDTFRDLVPDQCLNWLTKEESAAHWQQWFTETRKMREQFLYVAESNAERVIGCALAGPLMNNNAYKGELFLLSVLPAYQRKGIGRKLLVSAAIRLAKSNIQSMQVGVLTLNPNRHFYERLGAQYLSEHPYDWNGVSLSEAIYGWSDTTHLILKNYQE